MPTLTVFQPLDGAHAATDLVADPNAWLPSGSRAAGPARWHVPLHAGAMSRTVRCHVGPPVRRRSGTWRTLVWEPVSEPGDAVPIERALPTFTGEIGMDRRDGGRVTLVLDGTYDVPLGAVGEAVDKLLLGRFARGAAVKLLAEIAGRMDQITRPLTTAGRTRTQ